MGEAPLDLEMFRLADGETVPVKPKPPRRYQGEFLRGPIPWAWLRVANALPGRALTVGLVLWREAGMRKKMTFRLQRSKLHDFGLKRDTSRRGLLDLEKAGLIAVVRKPGRKLEVTLCGTAKRNGGE